MKSTQRAKKAENASSPVKYICFVPIDTDENSVETILVRKMGMAKRRTKRGQGGSLANRLRMKRRDRGWTQEQLAAAAGTTQAVIQKIENGKSLRPRRIEEIAKALEADPAWLMFGAQAVGDLDDEAMEVATAWSKLPEPHRSALKDAILNMVAGGKHD